MVEGLIGAALFFVGLAVASFVVFVVQQIRGRSEARTAVHQLQELTKLLGARLEALERQMASLREAVASPAKLLSRPTEPSTPPGTVPARAEDSMVSPPIAALATPPLVSQVAPSPASVEQLAAPDHTFTPVVEPQPVSVKTATVPVATPPVRHSLEQRLGTNWLNRIGITLLVFGIAFFLAFQVTHLGPLGKVLTGFAVSAAILAGGLWLERKPQYRVFARAGVGGGWALTFFTTYAMYYIPATAVLSSEFADLALLFCVGVGMVAHSLRYRSQVVTGLAFLLAFSIVTISHQTLYSLLASAILALGLEVVCLREEWFALEIAGIAAAYLNHFLWLSRTLHAEMGPGQPFAEFWQSTSVLLLFFVIFRLGYVLRRPSNIHAETMSGVAAVLNAAVVLAVMKYQSFHPQWAFRALLLFGALEFVSAFVVRARKRPSAFAVLATLASVLLLAAVPFRYDGATWALLWLAEAEALWLAGFFLRERTLRLLGNAGLLLTIAKLAFADVPPAMAAASTGGHRLLIAALLLGAAALWVNSEGLKRKLALPVGSPESIASRLSSAAAAVSAVLGVWMWTDNWTTAVAWAVLAILLVETGLRRRSLLLRIEGYAVLLATAVHLLTIDFAHPAVRFAGVDRRAVAAVLIIAACVFVSERLRSRSSREDHGLRSWEEGFAVGAAGTAATTVLSSLLYLELQAQWLAAGWASLAVLQTTGALRRDGARPRAQAMLLSVLVLLRVVTLNLSGPLAWQRWPAYIAAVLLFAAVPVAFRLRLKLLEGRFASWFLLRRPEQMLFFIPLLLVTALLWNRLSHGALTVAICTLGVLVFLLALGIGERTYRLAGLGLLLAGVAKLVLWDVWQLRPTERYLSLIAVGVALLMVSFLYSRYADRIKRYL